MLTTGRRYGGVYVLPRFRFVHLLWVALTIGGLLVFGSDHAEAKEVLASWYGPVTVSDRGPYRGERELDLSQRAARALGLIKYGVDYVEVNCTNGDNYPNCSGNPAGKPATTAPTTPAPE